MKILIPFIVLLNATTIHSVIKFEQFKFSGAKYFTLTGTNRVDHVYDRLRDVLSSDAQSDDVSTKKVNGAWCVTVKDKVFVTVTATDSMFHKTEPKKLAKVWAFNLQSNLDSVKPR